MLFAILLPLSVRYIIYRIKRYVLHKKILILIVICLFSLLLLTGCIVNDEEILEFAEYSTESYLVAINELDYGKYRKDFDDVLLSTITEQEFLDFSSYLKDTVGDYIPGSKEFSYTSSQKGLYLVFFNAAYTLEEEVEIQMIFVKEGDEYKIGGSWFDSEKIQENDYE